MGANFVLVQQFEFGIHHCPYVAEAFLRGKQAALVLSVCGDSKCAMARAGTHTTPTVSNRLQLLTQAHNCIITFGPSQIKCVIYPMAYLTLSKNVRFIAMRSQALHLATLGIEHQPCTLVVRTAQFPSRHDHSIARDM